MICLSRNCNSFLNLVYSPVKCYYLDHTYRCDQSVLNSVESSLWSLLSSLTLALLAHVTIWSLMTIYSGVDARRFRSARKRRPKRLLTERLLTVGHFFNILHTHERQTIFYLAQERHSGML